ncbi:MAG: hypothetical protein ACREUT_20420 [Steroidobacteraceae bacterium]
MMSSPARRSNGLAGALGSIALLVAAPAFPDDQLILNGNWGTLTGTNGGEGGSLDFLHSTTHTVIGVGGEYQKLATASWEFGSLTGALRGGSDTKWSLDGEVHRGAGEIAEYAGTHHFDYGIEAFGASGTFFNKLTLQLESRQFDIDTTHGNLPKLGLGVLWARTWLTTVSYARSVSGNLGTELGTLRVDRFGRVVNLIAGAATGHVAPPVVNIQTGALGSAPQYREGYIGFTRKFTRVDLGLLGDYLTLAGTRRITITLTLTVHLDRTGV